jgi:hypothetical protein
MRNAALTVIAVLLIAACSRVNQENSVNLLGISGTASRWSDATR